MSVMGLLLPAVLHSTRTELHFGKSELALSRFSSCVMLFAYAAYLYFQLKSQNKIYDMVSDNEVGLDYSCYLCIVAFALRHDLLKLIPVRNYPLIDFTNRTHI